MDWLIDIGFTVLLKLLKNKRESEKYQAAFFKLHAAIETVWPQLDPDKPEFKERREG